MTVRATSPVGQRSRTWRLSRPTGAVGLTEAQAGDAGCNVRTGVEPVPSTARRWIHKAGCGT